MAAGTDFPEFFGKARRHRSGNGHRQSTSIIRSYASPSELFDYSIRLAYRKVECVRCRDEIEHLPFRRILESFAIEKDIEVTLAADLPSFSGLGSSSSFTVGLINASNAHQGQFIPKQELARLAIQIKRDVLHEAVGCQDQIFAAYGSLNLIEFASDGDSSCTGSACRSPGFMNWITASLLFFHRHHAAGG